MPCLRHSIPVMAMFLLPNQAASNLRIPIERIQSDCFTLCLLSIKSCVFRFALLRFTSTAPLRGTTTLVPPESGKGHLSLAPSSPPESVDGSPRSPVSPLPPASDSPAEKHNSNS
ncbi:hypothetical protein NC651_020858 [Populus alba x Populus x berolinensis]|nr:hypothetical protein NC651_020858 [Populus alba x Populus x berolinensis]